MPDAKDKPLSTFRTPGLLELSEDERSFVANPALLEALTPAVREKLRRMAIARLVEHFGEGEDVIVGRVEGSIG